jgi:lipid II:glycine glycyltransferase (peptidoglycan interpeptide bridge formation enzyme)
VTKLNNKAVASIFLIYHNKEVRYAFAGAVYDREILKMQPYHLIMWEAIKDACERNYNVFNFGGATASTNMGGLYEFKKKWSDEIIEIPSYFYSNKEVSGVNENNLMFKLASGIWKKLPLPLVKKLSPIAIKQFV